MQTPTLVQEKDAYTTKIKRMAKYDTGRDTEGDGAILYETFQEYFTKHGFARNWKSTKAKQILNNDFNYWRKLKDFDAQIFESIKRRTLKRGYPDLWKMLEKRFVERGSIKKSIEPLLPKTEEIFLKSTHARTLQEKEKALEKIERLEAGINKEIKEELAELRRIISEGIAQNQKIFANQAEIRDILKEMKA